MPLNQKNVSSRKVVLFFQLPLATLLKLKKSINAVKTYFSLHVNTEVGGLVCKMVARQVLPQWLSNDSIDYVLAGGGPGLAGWCVHLKP